MRVRRSLLGRSAVLRNGDISCGDVRTNAKIGEARAGVETPQKGKQQKKDDKHCRLTQHYASPNGYHVLT